MISRTITSSPARAHTSAMPEPIRPAPTTPTRSIVDPFCVMPRSLPHEAAAAVTPVPRPTLCGCPRSTACPVPANSAWPCASRPTPCATSVAATRGCTTSIGAVRQPREGAAGDLAVVFDSDRKFAAIGLYDPASPMRIKRAPPRPPGHHRPRVLGWPASADALVARRQPLLRPRRHHRLPLHQRRERRLARPGPRSLRPHAGDEAVLRQRGCRTSPTSCRSSTSRSIPRPRAAARAATSPEAALHGLEEGDALIGTPPTRPGAVPGARSDVRGRRRARTEDRATSSISATTARMRAHDRRGRARARRVRQHRRVHRARRRRWRHAVTAVDLSEPTLAAAGRNLARNAHLPAVAACTYKPDVGRCVPGDGSAVQQGEKFDVVVIDPPSFTQRQFETGRALAATPSSPTSACARAPWRAVRAVLVQHPVTADEFHARWRARGGAPADHWTRCAARHMRSTTR